MLIYFERDGKESGLDQEERNKEERKKEERDQEERNKEERDQECQHFKSLLIQKHFFTIVNIFREGRERKWFGSRGKE